MNNSITKKETIDLLMFSNYKVVITYRCPDSGDILKGLLIDSGISLKGEYFVCIDNFNKRVEVSDCIKYNITKDKWH